jgi:hypothetical protein
MVGSSVGARDAFVVVQLHFAHLPHMTGCSLGREKFGRDKKLCPIHSCRGMYRHCFLMNVMAMACTMFQDGATSYSPGGAKTLKVWRSAATL